MIVVAQVADPRSHRRTGAKNPPEASAGPAADGTMKPEDYVEGQTPRHQAAGCPLSRKNVTIKAVSAPKECLWVSRKNVKRCLKECLGTPKPPEEVRSKKPVTRPEQGSPRRRKPRRGTSRRRPRGPPAKGTPFRDRGVGPEHVSVRRLGPDCRGGSLLPKASR